MRIWYGHKWPKYIIVYLGKKHYRRKFRSQTSDNMDRWKSRGGKSQRGEEPKREDQRRSEKIREDQRRSEKIREDQRRSEKIREDQRRSEKIREDQRRERVRRKKMQVREKVEKSRNTVFFQWFVALKGRKVGSLKRRVCGAMWSDERWKVARRCGEKHISKSKCTKHTNLGPLLEVEMLKKCTPLWLEPDFQVKSVKNWRARSTFGRSDVVSWGRRKGLCTLSKVSKTWGFCGSCNYNHHYTTLHYTTLHSTTTTTTILHYTTLHYTNYTTLHDSQLHYNYSCTTLH